jgi:Probable Zinc-ribbon domain
MSNKNCNCIKKLCEHYNLFTEFPLICEEWDYTKNGKLPSEYSPSSLVKVWWKCKINICGCHYWQAVIRDRTYKKSGCHYCSNRSLCAHNNLLKKFPVLCEEWDHSKNEKSPSEYPPCSGLKVWWKCANNPCGCHVWFGVISHRTSGVGCPYCSGRNVCEHYNLLTEYPKLCEEWDYLKNEEGPENYSISSNKNVWWKCTKNICGCHCWESSISNRTSNQKRNCPYCSNKAVCEHNNLAITHTKLCKEWDYTKNIKLPQNYSFGSGTKVWWVCKLTFVVAIIGRLLLIREQQKILGALFVRKINFVSMVRL